MGRPTHLGLLANAYGKAGQPEAGLRVLSEALALVKNTGERFAEPILLRFKGELILMSSGDEAGSSTRAKEAEACFQAAIAMVHDQGARLVELKGALSVARIWQRCGKTDAARPILAGVHGTFTEGFDTVDWQDAKVLLEELT